MSASNSRAAHNSCSDAETTTHPISAGVDWTQLPGACRLLIVRHMERSTRAAWRSVSQLTRKDLHGATHTLTWRGEHHQLESTNSDRSSPKPSPITLPAALIASLPSLLHLNCSGMSDLTSIQGIPATLRSLDLVSCYSLTSLAPLQHCTALEQLSLKCNRSTLLMLPLVLSAASSCLRQLKVTIPDTADDAVAEAVVRSLEPLTSLRQLSLCLYSGNPVHWQALAHAVGRLTDLRALDATKGIDNMSYYSSFDEQLELTPAIRQLKQLQSLNLSGTWLMSGTTVALSEAIASLPPTLTRLDLSRTLIDPDKLSALVPAFQAQAATLKTIRLSPIFTNTDRAPPLFLEADGMAALAPGLQCCSSLTDVDLSRGHVGAAGAASLAAALSSCVGSLTSLDVTRNKLGARGAELFAPTLSAMTGLVNLSCGANWFGPVGAAALAPVLSSIAPSLAFLGLSYNQLAVEGAAALAPALGRMTSLVSLDLSDNKVTAAGTASLAPALVAIAPSLTSLYMSHNDLGDGGATALAPALSTMTALITLNLCSNRLGPAGAAALASALALLPCLAYLDLRANCLGFQGLGALAQGLRVLQGRQHWQIYCSPDHVALGKLHHPGDAQLLASIMSGCSQRCSWNVHRSCGMSGAGDSTVVGVEVAVCTP